MCDPQIVKLIELNLSLNVCVYYMDMNGSIYLRLNIDIMLSAHKNMLELCNLKARLNREFEIKDLGFVKKVLGMEISKMRKVSTLLL